MGFFDFLTNIFKPKKKDSVRPTEQKIQYPGKKRRLSTISWKEFKNIEHFGLEKYKD